MPPPTLDGRTLATEGNTAGQGDRCAEELAKNSAQGDAALVGIEGGFGLWNTATARRIREETVEEIAHTERAEDGDDEASPVRATSGIKARAKPLGDEDEGNDDQADEGADK